MQNKFVGTGHSDITKFEWASNQHRDTLASHIGHNDMLSYFAVAQNDSIGRVRYQLLEVRIFFSGAFFVQLSSLSLIPSINSVRIIPQKMLQPCGPPPVKDDDDGDR